MVLALILAPLAAVGDGDRASALRAIRDLAAALEQRAESAKTPEWLATSPHDKASAAGEALGQEQRERFREDSPKVSACRDLGQLCSTGTPRETGASRERALVSVQVGQPAEPVTDAGPRATALGAQDVTITVLASRSLGPAQLKEIFAFAADTPRVRVAFRGVAADESLMDFVREVHGLLAGIEPMPEVVLDPTPFAAAKIDIVPVLLAHGPDGEVARVAGLADPLWLRSRVLAGDRGDLGVRGPVKPVTEPDLIEELKRRLAALDLDKPRERALERYWRHLGFEELPVAAEPRTREIDPTITAPRDLRTTDGTLLVQAGERVNPLDRLPFTQRLVVFDATDERQVATARRLGREAGERRVLYLATQLERSRGWEGLASVEDVLDAPVYLLTPDVRQRFALERVPAFVEARGRAFIVAEVPPEAGR